MEEILALLEETIDDGSVSVVSQNCIKSISGKEYFYKLIPGDDEQCRGEAESLKLLSKAAPGIAPGLVLCQKVPRGTIFVSEYIDFGGSLSISSFEELAKRLSTEVHQYKSESGFGFGLPSYCGATKISHGWFSTWSECYSNMLGDLLFQLQARGHQYLDLCEKGHELRNRYEFNND
jgi:protein-ribulosamine 3-kinase